MKTVLTTNPVFTPASKTLDFSGVSPFLINRLMAVIDQTTNTLIYAVSASGLGYTSWTSGTGILVLQKDTTTGGYNAADSLICIYDDPAPKVSISTSTSTGIPNTIDIVSDGALTTTAVKSGISTLFGVQISPNRVDSGIGCYPAYLKFYNSASVTVGTTPSFLTICIVDTSGNTPFQNAIPINGILFSTAITCAIVADPSDTSTAVAQSGHMITLQYI